jgi:glyoxylase-like metal-dependent hydrolase (beta-lactamase superfamily II)
MGTPTVNWYLIREGDRFTAIDSGLRGYGARLEEELAAVGAKLGDIEAVVLTHSDGDHTGMAATMENAGARVLIHGGDELTLRKPGPKGGEATPLRTVPYLWRPVMLRFTSHLLRNGWARPVPPKEIELFDHGDELDVPGHPRVLHTPGHTLGHSLLMLWDRGIIFAGDSVCTWNPFDGSRGDPQLMPPPANVDNAQARASFDRVLALQANLLLPGHGDPWRASSAVAA